MDAFGKYPWRLKILRNNAAWRAPYDQAMWDNRDRSINIAVNMYERKMLTQKVLTRALDLGTSSISKRVSAKNKVVKDAAIDEDRKKKREYDRKWGRNAGVTSSKGIWYMANVARSIVRAGVTHD